MQVKTSFYNYIKKGLYYDMDDIAFKKIPVGRAKDLTNQIFGSLTVLYRIENNSNNKAKWACQCVCGKIIGVIGTDLTRGHTKSCGCQKSKFVSNTHAISEIGNKYGRLTVIEQAGSTLDRHALWKCQCDCGNIIKVTGKLLRKGQVQSCGCLQKEKAANLLRQFSSNHYINEIGNKYGKLTVIAKADKQDDSNGTWWKCQCDCGNIKITKGQYLRNGSVSSCGCLTSSKGELIISTILEKNNINFKKEYCIVIDNIKYRYDFAIFDTNNNLLYLIEFDGKQHFQENEYFGGEKQFNKTIFNDNLKNQWCKQNNVPLIRIPYTHLKEISIKDLQLKTSNFII